ncbi:hypothetical protein [Thalassotalea maritima]|uniref:hypothetical protein n=1 Tax=Thalassotalea maritima TaxID=3242416 RepID=UPI003529C27D
MQKRYPLLALVIIAAIIASFSISASTSTQWKQVGDAKLKVMFWDVYTARLYTETGKFDGIQGPLKLHLTYHIDIDADELAEETGKQWRKMNFKHPDDSAWVAELHQIFPSLKRYDSLTLILDEQGQGKLLHNNQPHHDFEPSVQLQQFLAIWLSKRSTRPDLVAELTGQR